MFDTPDRVDQQIFWTLFRRAKDGQPLSIDKQAAEVFSSLPAYVFRVAQRHHANYLGRSRWSYRGGDFNCLQIVWPDPTGLFPWEHGFGPEFASGQADLTERDWVSEISD